MRGRGSPHVGRHNLLVPRSAREVEIAKETAADLAICAVTANNVVGSESLLPLVLHIDIHPRLLLVLAQGQNLVAVLDRGVLVLDEVLVYDLTDALQRQTDHPVWVAVVNAAVQPGDVREVGLPPADGLRGKPLLAQLVCDPCPTQLVHCWGGVVCCTRRRVQVVVLLKDIDGNAFLREEESEEEARGPGPDDNDFVDCHDGCTVKLEV